MARLLLVTISLTLLVTPLAGCIIPEDQARLHETEPATEYLEIEEGLEPQSVRVGTSRFGDVFKFEVKASWTSPDSGQVEDDESTLTVTVSDPFGTYDSARNPTTAVRQTFAYGSDHYVHSSVIDVKTRRSLYDDGSYRFMSSSSSCGAFGCSSQESEGVEHFRVFDEAGSDPSPFEGRVLVLGETFTLDDDSATEFIVKEIREEEGRPVAIVEAVDEEEGGMDLQLWFVDDVPVPVLLKFSFEGFPDYAIEGEQRLVGSSRGEKEIGWKHVPQTPVSLELPLQSPGEFLATPTDTHYSLDEAWKSVSTDPFLMLTGGSRDEYPAQVRYFPNEAEREWTWTFVFADTVIESKLSEILGIEGTQNRETNECCFFTEFEKPGPVIPVADAFAIDDWVRAQAGLQPSGPDRAFTVSLAREMWDEGFHSSMEYQITGETSQSFPYDPVRLDAQTGHLTYFGLGMMDYYAPSGTWLAPWIPRLP